MTMIKKLMGFLTVSERNYAYRLMAMILLMACLDVLGVASILPFMAVLTNPDLVHSNAMLFKAYNASGYIGISTIEEFLFALGVLVFITLTISLIFKALTTYAQTRFVLMREYSIGKRLVEGYLNKPYSWFLNQHSADLGKSILSEVNAVVNNGMMPMMALMAQGVVTVMFFLLLLIVDLGLALGSILILGAAYASIYFFARKWLSHLGQSRVVANQERYKSVSEAFGAIKELKVTGLEKEYVRRFSKPALTYAESNAAARAVGVLPRYALEIIIFGGLLVTILYLMRDNSSFVEIIPIISLFVFAGYRLMPALQQMYQAFTQLRFIGPTLDSLHVNLSRLQIKNRDQHESNSFVVNQSIKLQSVSYCYPGAERQALKGIDISIPARSMVGFVGTTGSGKTTTIDIIIGLLVPQEGELKIDGQTIMAANLQPWKRAIGYVPQHIYLADDSVVANIAFGVPVKDIDLQAVERAAKTANLHEFVINELPQGYATTVGERGVRLSGGQRQRIGIARALYRNPQVLILDEATSALDNLTEEAVMKAVNNLYHDTTVIVVAHRLSTVRQCDQIYLLERGELKATGNFEELLNGSEQFKLMSRHA